MIGENEIKNERVMQACLANRLGYEIFMNLDKEQGYLEIFFITENQKNKLQLVLKCFYESFGDIKWYGKGTEYDGVIEKPHCLIEIY